MKDNGVLLLMNEHGAGLASFLCYYHLKAYLLHYKV